MLSIKLFRLVFCLFRFNRNIETLCFGIDAKQPKQTISQKNQNKPKETGKPQNFPEKIPKCAPYQTFSVGQCRNQFWFQFRLFRIKTSFEGYPCSTAPPHPPPPPADTIEKGERECEGVQQHRVHTELPWPISGVIPS